MGWSDGHFKQTREAREMRKTRVWSKIESKVLNNEKKLE